MFNISSLFIGKFLFATNINAFPFIQEIIQYCIDECSSGFMLPLLFLGFIVNLILYSGVAYSLLFLMRGVISNKLSQYFHYPQYLNILIRFIPFGYILTSIITIARGNNYLKGLGKEILYSIGITFIYILIACFLYWNYMHLHY